MKDGKPAEIAAFLGEVSDPQAGPLVHGQEGDVDGIEGDGAAVRLDHAEDHAEGGGFSGPVAAEKPDDFALTQQEADVVDDNAAVVGFYELGDFQEGSFCPRGSGADSLSHGSGKSSLPTVVDNSWITPSDRLPIRSSDN